MNGNLIQAKRTKNDEFYTRLIDIEKELQHYRRHFKDKVVYCNCDDYRQSKFVEYFSDNFNELGLKRVISTNYTEDGDSYLYIKDETGEKIKRLEGNGDFRSEESIRILEEADIVVTNPPFSLFREYVAQLDRYQKRFLVIGNQNAVMCKEIFPLIKENKVWLGVKSGGMRFSTPENKVKSVSACWYTNLEHAVMPKGVTLTKAYDAKEYQTYDNYDAIEVGKVADIPKDYYGIIAVPITFLNKYNPDQFEILGSRKWAKSKELLEAYTGDVYPPENDIKLFINGKEPYERIFIKRKRW